MPPSLLARLVDELDRAEVAIVRTENGFEPLCAAFRRPNRDFLSVRRDARRTCFDAFLRTLQPGRGLPD